MRNKTLNLILVLLVVCTIVGCSDTEDITTMNVSPVTNTTYSLGSPSLHYLAGWFDTLYMNGVLLNLSSMVGPQGPQGPAGLNSSPALNFVNSSTGTDLVGVLSGNGSYISASNNLSVSNLYVNASFGTELAPTVSAANYTGTNWVFAGSTAQHTASDTNTLYPTVPIVPVVGTQYKVTYTISGWTAGSQYMTFGGVAGVARSGNQDVYVYVSPYTTGNLIFTPTADFRGKISNVSVKAITSGTVYVDRNIWMYDDRGVLTSQAALMSHLSELANNTLLDRSRSSLSCAGGVLTYTLYAMDGSGTWNFNGITYPAAISSASLPLTAGTNASPKTNFVYFELQGNVPTLVASIVEPTTNHIDVATWVVGAVSGTNYTIYGYNRNRQEIDSFISRSIDRISDSGTMYISGMLPTVNSTALSVAGSGKFYNGIFTMTTANDVSMLGGFFYVNASGAFVQATTIGELNKYADGTTLGANERQNIVWGLVPTTTAAGGASPVQVRLVAVLQTKPTAVYVNDAQARQDLYEATNYYPSNAELKKIFVPICKTIVHPNSNTFSTFDTGLYMKDVRGKITSGGGAAVAPDLSMLVPYTGATSNLSYGGATLRLDGSFAPASIADVSAMNNSIYFSTDSSKLAYKDSVGVVHDLY